MARSVRALFRSSLHRSSIAIRPLATTLIVVRRVLIQDGRHALRRAAQRRATPQAARIFWPLGPKASAALGGAAPGRFLP